MEELELTGDKVIKKEELVKLFQSAYQSTIATLINIKSSRKKTMALESMWLRNRKADGATCGRCKTTDNLTVDHIVPISLLEQLGLEPTLNFIPHNYEVLCKRCNRFKANRLDFANPKTKPLLKEFVDNC